MLPPLRNPDDMYIIMGLGDETTVQFEATSASALPAGWKRDFLLYADGWIKDSLTRPSAEPRSRTRQEAFQPAVAPEHLHSRARDSRGRG